MYVVNEIRKTFYDKEQKDSRLQRLIDLFKKEAGWQELGYLTWEQCCEERLQRPASEIEREATQRVATLAENAKPLAATAGGDKRSMEYENHYSDQNNDSPKGGENAEYLTARIARDHPEILEGMKRGEYKSVRAAAIEAGMPEGLKASIDLLMKICQSYDDMEAVDMLAQQSAGKRGGNNNPYGAKGKPDSEINVNNINIDKEMSRPMGTSAAATIRRLSKDFPGLHAKVLNGEISPNEAAIKAGFRKKKYPQPENKKGQGMNPDLMV